MVLVIIAGHIDLSVGSVAAFVGIVRGPRHARLGHALVPSASCSAWRSASLIGAWQGFWVAYVGIPAFIVTLAGMLIFRGANQFVGKSNTIPVPDGLPGDRLRLPARGRARTPATTTSPCCSACSPSPSWSSARSASRRNAKALGADGRPRPGSRIVKLVLICGAILYATYLLRHRPRRARPSRSPGLILAVAGHRLRLHLLQDRRRPPHLRGRRQPARRRALRRRSPRRSTSWS